MNNVILTDCDGVLLNWIGRFDPWVKQYHGIEARDNGHLEWNMEKRYVVDKDRGIDLIKVFNESAAIAFLPPYKDAIKYVKKLHEEYGYVFHVITSFGSNHEAHKLRIYNLERLFGEAIFERYVFLDLHISKEEILKEYEGTDCYWIEDHPENANLGNKYGLRPYLMNAPYNQNKKSGFTRINNWKHVYNLIGKNKT